MLSQTNIRKLLPVEVVGEINIGRKLTYRSVERELIAARKRLFDKCKNGYVPQDISRYISIIEVIQDSMHTGLMLGQNNKEGKIK